MQKKLSRQELKKMVEKSIIREEEKQWITSFASRSVNEVMNNLGASANGLDDEQISRNRVLYGKNQTNIEKKNLAGRIKNYLDKSKCFVIRKHKKPEKILNKELVVGDIVYLSKGDIVPADLRVIVSKDLKVNQKAITGNTEEIEKSADVYSGRPQKVTDFINIVFEGTTVISGWGEAVVLSVGSRTLWATIK